MGNSATGRPAAQTSNRRTRQPPGKTAVCEQPPRWLTLREGQPFTQDAGAAVQGGLDVHRLRRADQVALRAEVDRICDQRMQLG